MAKKKKFKGTGRLLKLSKGWLQRVNYVWHVSLAGQFLGNPLQFNNLGSALFYMGYKPINKLSQNMFDTQFHGGYCEAQLETNEKKK